MLEVQKTKSGPAAKQHLFLFPGLPRTPTHANDLFIQPYTSNHKDMHWNRFKKLVYLRDIYGFWLDGDPHQENVVQKLCFSTTFWISKMLSILEKTGTEQ